MNGNTVNRISSVQQCHAWHRVRGNVSNGKSQARAPKWTVWPKPEFEIHSSENPGSSNS